MRKITDADRRAAERLREIYQAKKGELGLTQEKIGELYGEASQGLISQYMNGRIALGAVATLKFAGILRVTPTDIRPDFQWTILPGELPQDVVEMAIKIAALPSDVREDIAKTINALSGSKYAVLLHNFARQRNEETTKLERR